VLAKNHFSSRFQEKEDSRIYRGTESNSSKTTSIKFVDYFKGLQQINIFYKHF